MDTISVVLLSPVLTSFTPSSSHSITTLQVPVLKASTCPEVTIIASPALLSAMAMDRGSENMTRRGLLVAAS
jgi:hypothetical protein